MSESEDIQNKESEQVIEEIPLHPTILKEFKLEEDIKVKADKKFELAHKLYVDLAKDIEEFEKIDEGFKDTCGKVNFIREFCVIEYLLRRDRSHPRYSFNYFGAVVLSLDCEWWRYKIFESLNSLADARNNVAHTFDYGGEYKSGDQDTSVLNKDYVKSTGRKILKLLFLRMIDENLQSTTEEMQNKWYSKVEKKKRKERNFSKDEGREEVEPDVKNFYIEIPRSRFENIINEKLPKLFGSIEIPKRSCTIGINAYGGLILKMHKIINLLSDFHTEDEVSAQYRRLPDENKFKDILRKIRNAIKELPDLVNELSSNSMSGSKEKKSIYFFNRSPLALVFAFGWYYKKEGIENKLRALLEIRGNDKENPKSTFVKIKANYQTSTSGLWKVSEVSTKESQQEIMLLVKFKWDRVEKIREDYPHYHIVEINPKGDFIVSEEKEVYEYAGELKEILQSFAGKSNHINLALRLPTPLVLQLGYILANSGKSITIYKDDSRRYGEEEKLHKLFTLE